MQKKLATLPCFNHVKSISAIDTGLSQHCFKVNADNKIYFAKTINGETETNIALKAAEQEFSPTIFYHDKNWLITTFIDSETLASTTVDNDKDQVKKINLALLLMSKCHQLNIKPYPLIPEQLIPEQLIPEQLIPEQLIPEQLITELIDQSIFSSNKKKELLRLAELILAPLNTAVNLVCCHGDLNFSNVLVDQQKKTWLVDYECACLAPAEYDLAMFIAINNINQDQVAEIIKFYRQQYVVNVDRQLLNSYQLYCYFINALWYFNACTSIKCHNDKNRNDNKKKLNALAIQQWNNLITHLNTEHSQLFSSLSIKLSDVLTTFDFDN